MRLLYTLLLYLALPFILLRLLWRSRRLPAYRKRLRERFGYYPTVYSARRIWWLHAVSVGEMVAAKPLVQALLDQYPTIAILLTTITPTGAQQAAALLSDRVQHVYLPYDYPFAMRRFIAQFKPEVGIIMETELWPNLLAIWRKQRQKCPIFLLNARLSLASSRGYRRMGGLTQTMLRTFTAIAAQSAADAERFIELGALPEQVTVTGNIKFDVPLPADLAARAALFKRQLGDRLIWVAASTHAGEEEQMLAAHQIILAEHPHALLILAPRHPDRFAAVINRCQLQLAAGSVHVVDKLGELMLMYAVADIAFVGGSLIPQGGHNLLEPAALAKPIISGPHLFNFVAISNLLKEANALTIVENADELAKAVLALQADPALARAQGAAAVAVVKANQGVLARQLAVVQLKVQVPSLAGC